MYLPVAILCRSSLSCFWYMYLFYVLFVRRNSVKISRGSTLWSDGVVIVLNMFTCPSVIQSLKPEHCKITDHTNTLYLGSLKLYNGFMGVSHEFLSSWVFRKYYYWQFTSHKNHKNNFYYIYIHVVKNDQMRPLATHHIFNPLFLEWENLSLVNSFINTFVVTPINIYRRCTKLAYTQDYLIQLPEYNTLSLLHSFERFAPSPWPYSINWEPSLKHLLPHKLKLLQQDIIFENIFRSNCHQLYQKELLCYPNNTKETPPPGLSHVCKTGPPPWLPMLHFLGRWRWRALPVYLCHEDIIWKRVLAASTGGYAYSINIKVERPLQTIKTMFHIELLSQSHNDEIFSHFYQYTI